jgi:prepilin-type N-terminal cleavage/methylation domain-containing protein
VKVLKAGFTLLELLIVAVIFSLFLLVSYGLLSSGMGVWQKTASSQDVGFQLGKARFSLQRDIRDASFTNSEVSLQPGMAADLARGDVLWFLSAVDPSTGQFTRKVDGTPFWQKNILYYLTVPLRHDQLFGVSCQSAKYHCPHHFLVRRVIDSGPPTSPLGPVDDEETLLAPSQIEDWVKRPDSFSLDLNNPLPDGDHLVASGLLDFDVSMAPDATGGEIEIRLMGFDLDQAGKKIALGREDLKDSPYTHHFLASYFPGN